MAPAESVIVNDEELGLWHDMMEWVEKVAPEKPNYLHHRTGEFDGQRNKRVLVKVMGEYLFVPD